MTLLLNDIDFVLSPHDSFQFFTVKFILWNVYMLLVTILNICLMPRLQRSRSELYLKWSWCDLSAFSNDSDQSKPISSRGLIRSRTSARLKRSLEVYCPCVYLFIEVFLTAAL